MENYKLSDLQAQAILDMRLQKLTGLEMDKIRDEYNSIKKIIEELNAILSSDVKQYQIIKMQNNKKNLKETIQKRLSVLSFLIAIIPLFFIIRATLFLAQFSPPFFNLSQIRGDP